jgi:hypothetical protein
MPDNAGLPKHDVCGCESPERLRETIAGLLADNQRMRALLAPPPLFYPTLGLSERERGILALLHTASPGLASPARLRDAVYGEASGKPANDKIFDVWMYNLRGKLPAGVEIRNQRGRGWFIPQAGRDALDEIVAAGKE